MNCLIRMLRQRQSGAVVTPVITDDDLLAVFVHKAEIIVVVVVITVQAHAALQEVLGKLQLRFLAASEQPADIIDAVTGQAVALDVLRRKRLEHTLSFFLEETRLDVLRVRQVVDGAMNSVVPVGDDVSLLRVHLCCQLHGQSCQ